MAYVVEKAGLHYAVIYEGVNPITGGSGGDGTAAPTEPTQRRALATAPGAARPRSTGRVDDDARRLPAWPVASSPGSGAVARHLRPVLTSVEHYLLPHLGDVQLLQLHADQLTALYRRLGLTGSQTGGALAAKTILNLRQLR